MAATQLCFDFIDVPIIPKTSSHKRIIPFPVPPKVPIPQRKGIQAVLYNDFASFAPYGSWLNYNKRLTASERLRKNKEAVTLLAKSRNQLTPTELDTIRSYSGWGGLSATDERGVLYDYYTSPPIAAFVWR